MASLHFYLEKRKAKESKGKERDCPLILSFSYASFRIKTYTGRKIREQEWDKADERVKLAFSKASEFNDYLDLLCTRVKEYFTDIQSTGGIPDTVQFQKEIKKMVRSEVPSFFNLLLRFIEENSVKWNPSTYKKMKTFYSQLKDFSNNTMLQILPGMVNQHFADKLIEFYRRKNLKDSTIKKNLDLLKWFMNWCLRKNLIFNRDFSTIRFSPEIRIETHKECYLKWDELTGFFIAKNLTKKEDWCKDMFCFIAFTGIRFSRLSKLGKESVKGNFIFTAGKGRKGKILLNRFAVELCKKYENRYYQNNTLFPVMSLITFHKHLQSAALKTGMNRTIFGQNLNPVPVPLYKMVSAQTAINTYFAHGVKLDIPEGLNSYSNSSKSRIIALSGSLKLAEEKQIITSDKLYESIRSSGLGT